MARANKATSLFILSHPPGVLVPDQLSLAGGYGYNKNLTSLAQVTSWLWNRVMYSNKFKLNAEKTEVLPVASTSRLSSVGRDSVDIGGKRIPFRSSVRNLGLHLDQTLSMQQHISSVCRAAYLELRRIASIRPYLTQSASAQLVSSAITSRQDYPWSRFHAYREWKNNAAKLVLRKSKYDHVTPLLQGLHWLPIKFLSLIHISEPTRR